MTDHTSEELTQLKKKAESELQQVADAAVLEKWRIAYLGRKGAVPKLLRGVKDLPTKARRAVGQAGNKLRRELTEAYQKRQQELEPSTARHSAGAAAVQPGHLHPITLALRQARDIFTSMGFSIVEGPNLEEAAYNFDNLNIDLEHPARAESDTFYIQDHPDRVLRTHVSTLQSRAVIEHDLTPPFKIFYYGPSYRAEKEDATHGAIFQQYEFMVVDETVNLADLKAIITEFYSRFFGSKTDIRFRPSYFPFVEPGLEVDMRDTITGKGDWLEMAGAGMVHPNVLRNINVDPARYQGIALGGGLDRLVMLKHGIPDLRLLYAGDLSFLRQF